MDETDLSFFGSKKKTKQDKADAHIASSDVANVERQETQVITSYHTDEDTYNTDNPYVGIALIFNHKTVKGQKARTGTEKDRDEISRTLRTYGYDVRVYNDLSFEKLVEQLKETAKEDHSQNDSFVLVVMSHGTEGKVYASDMSYPVDRLWNPFLGDNCKSLINKPKLFFIQACRGDALERPVVYAAEFSVMSRLAAPTAPEPPQVLTYAIPSTADMLVMYSTFERTYSFRNVEDGSWFIQTLCHVLDEAAMGSAHSEDGAELLNLLTTVNRRVAYGYQSNSSKKEYDQMKEMPNFMSTLTKTFYLKVKPKPFH